MTSLNPDPARSPRRIGRSFAAVFAGFIVVFVLSLGTDQLFHLLGVYPPWGEPMWATGRNLLALSYRLVYDTYGSYLTARLAPHSPMRHALIGGAFGLLLSTAGAVAMIPKEIGPAWYPILLALSALPTAWLGGWLFLRRQSGGTVPA